MESKLFIPEGIRIGHAGNARTGVTVILAERGAVCGVDVRGGAPGTRETDLLRPEKMMDKINAVVLSGGSAYGLEAGCGVMRFLRERGAGHAMGDKVVPIVCQAVLYDLSGEGYVYPDMAMGAEACRNAVADAPLIWGKTGAGTGATVGKILGPALASPGGIGAATVEAMGVHVTAVVAVNACGDIIDPATGAVVAGTRSPQGGFLSMKQVVLSGNIGALTAGANTTIGCVLTDAALDKVGANKLASIAHNGLARTISPAHTDYDGDTLFALSEGAVKSDFNLLGILAVEAVERAVLAAVRG